MIKLTSGTIARLLDTPSGTVVTQTFILQVVSTVKLHDPEDQPDQRVLNCHKFFVTDGEDEAQVVILDNLSSMVATNFLTQYSVMEVTKCLVQQLAGEHEGDPMTTHIIIREASIIRSLKNKIEPSTTAEPPATAEPPITAEPPATAEPGAKLHFIPPPVCLISDLTTMGQSDKAIRACIMKKTEIKSWKKSMPKLKHLSVRRNLMVVDDSGFQVHVTLWGDDATTFGAPVGSVVAFKGIRVSSYGERSLSLPDLGLIFVSPNVPQASYGSSVDSTMDSSAQLMTIAQINSDIIVAKSTGKRFYLSATIASISLKDFDKPLHSSTNCSKHMRPEPEHYYNFSLQASDGKDTIQIQCTDPVGNELFHATANEMVKLQSADKAAFARRIDRAVSKKCTFLCKACTVDFSGGLTFILAINASLDA
ncbi:Replication factor A protein 1 [Coemansia sp. RSA 2052]|nr:Replication factor A protein 1 [Coemansia sp. RSA 2052]